MKDYYFRAFLKGDFNPSTYLVHNIPNFAPGSLTLDLSGGACKFYTGLHPLWDLAEDLEISGFKNQCKIQKWEF